jgi:hypothetical protein
MSAGGNDIFVLKLSGADGNVGWVRTIGNEDNDLALGVAVAPATVIVVGSFLGTVDFGSGAEIAAGGTDAFIAWYSQTGGGTPIRSLRIGDGGADTAYAVATDPAGNVFVTGSFQGTVDFGVGDPLTSDTGSLDIFVSAYSALGAPLWAQRFGGAGPDEGLGIAVDDLGNSYVVGRFSQTADFGNGPVTAEGDDAVVLKLAPSDGATLWSTTIQGPSGTPGLAIAHDPRGAVAVTGLFRGDDSGGPTDFGGVMLTPLGVGDAYIAKYSDADGALLWARQFGSPELAQIDVGLGIAADPTGNVVVTGFFTGTAEFGNEPPLMSGGDMDVFVGKYGP